MSTDRSTLPYRPGVGIVVFNDEGLVFIGRRARRVGHEVWQWPQGGADDGEAPRDTALRELEEETGITSDEVEIVAELPGTVEYDLPADLENPPKWADRFRGQRQHWFAARFLGDDASIELPTKHREFDAYRWVTLDEAVAGAVDFKRVAYDAAAAHFRDIVDKRRRPATP